MKSAILILVIGLTAAFCPAPTDYRRVPLNQEFAIKFGETVLVEEGRLKVSLFEIAEDSRCPETVKCVWTGNGKIILLVSLRERQPGKIILNTTLDPKHDSYRNFDLELVKLDPYPKQGTTVTKDDYVATLIVKRK